MLMRDESKTVDAHILVKTLWILVNALIYLAHRFVIAIHQITFGVDTFLILDILCSQTIAEDA